MASPATGVETVYAKQAKPVMTVDSVQAEATTERPVLRMVLVPAEAAACPSLLTDARSIARWKQVGVAPYRDSPVPTVATAFLSQVKRVTTITRAMVTGAVPTAPPSRPTLGAPRSARPASNVVMALSKIPTKPATMVVFVLEEAMTGPFAPPTRPALAAAFVDRFPVTVVPSIVPRWSPASAVRALVVAPVEPAPVVATASRKPEKFAMTATRTTPTAAAPTVRASTTATAAKLRALVVICAATGSKKGARRATMETGANPPLMAAMRTASSMWDGVAQ